jgi:hypothetical protein
MTSLATGVLAASAASGGIAIASFTYSDLLGSYDTGTNVYRAVAGSQSSGDVTRLESPGGSAEFDNGFLGMGSANYELEMTVGNIQAATADASGSLTITDDNGDTLTAVVNGEFRIFGGSVSFEGLLSDVFFNDVSGDGTFDGTTSGSFSTDFAANPPFDGSILNLFFDPGSFFGTGFDGQTTLSSGLIVPAPTAFAAFAGLGLAGAARRRR